MTGAVGQLGAGTRELGKWDAALFEEYRAAEARPRPFTQAQAAESRALLGELARVNDRLVLRLVRQRCQRPEGDRGECVPGLKVVGSEALRWNDAVDAGRLAFMVAMGDFDPSKGKLSGWLNFKVVDELRHAVQGLGIVWQNRRKGPARMEYFEDRRELADAFERESSVELEDPDDPEPPRALPERAIELRRAMAVFLEDHCRFASSARAAASAVRGRYASVVLAHGEASPRGALTIALLHCGVHAMTVRVPWSDVPVEGFAGVSLQSVRA